MASLRKHPKLLPTPKRQWFTIDRGLLAGIAALVGLGSLQTGYVSFASRDTPSTEAATAVAGRAVADYTPVGSIVEAGAATAIKTEAEKKREDELKLQAPYGLRSKR